MEATVNANLDDNIRQEGASIVTDDEESNNEERNNNDDEIHDSSNNMTMPPMFTEDDDRLNDIRANEEIINNISGGVEGDNHDDNDNAPPLAGRDDKDSDSKDENEEELTLQWNLTLRAGRGK